MSTQKTQPASAGKRCGKHLTTRHRNIVRCPTTKVFYLYFKHKGKRHERSLETSVESVALVKAAEEIKTIKANLQEEEPVNVVGLTQGGRTMAEGASISNRAVL
jgi:hypothetical protein